jgi:hypothetical protein
LNDAALWRWPPFPITWEMDDITMYEKEKEKEKKLTSIPIKPITVS